MSPSRGTNRRLVAFGILSLTLFAAISILVSGDITQAFDARLALLININEGSAFTSIMVLASLYGREPFWISAVVLMLALGKRDVKLLAIELAALLAVGFVTGDLTKIIFDRPRPFDTVVGIITRVSPPIDSSYPSGHALIVSMGASFAVIKFRRRIVTTLLTLEALVVSYSRVYVGVHYPLDVLAGVLLGVAITSLGLVALEKLFAPHLQAVATLLEKYSRALRLPEIF